MPVAKELLTAETDSVALMLTGARVLRGYRAALFAHAGRLGLSVNEFVLLTAAEKIQRAGTSIPGVFAPGNEVNTTTRKDMTDLDDRIALALSGKMAANDIAQLLTDVDDAIAAAGKRLEAARTTAFDPLTRAADVRSARAEMADAEFFRERLEAAKARIKGALDEATTRERKAGQAAEYVAAKAERDQVARELAEKYPAIVAELTDLLGRLEANNARVRKARAGRTGDEWLNLAEAVARHAPKNWETGNSAFPSVLSIRLPAFTMEVGSPTWAWPSQAPQLQVA